MRSGIALGLALSLGLSSIAQAGPPEPTVVITKFSGDPYLAEDQRGRIAAAFERHGYDARIGEGKPSVGRTKYEYMVEADLPREGMGEVVVSNLATGLTIFRVELSLSDNDFVLYEMLGEAVARRLDELRVPPSPASAAELEILAALDEPTEPFAFRTHEDICNQPGVCCYPANPPYRHRDDPDHVDLVDHDFKQYCRTQPREGPADLRPVCRLGPSFGYFRPRTWTSLSLTGASTVATGVLYALAYAPSKLPPPTTDRLEIAGHVMLGTTLVLGTILTLVILSDRRQAKRFILKEKKRLTPIE